MIPVCEPLIGEEELENVVDCIKTGWISSKGKYLEKFEEEFSKYCGTKYGVTTTNGTTALHLAPASLGITKGDEVIVPTFTMISPVLAVVYTGAKPVLVDAEPETWNMDVNLIQEKITKKTKAILAVHIYGHPCDMDPILKLAKDHNLYLIEDAAEAHGAEYKNRKCGGIGDVGCFSFYANKIITTGEGGMVVTNNKEIAEKAKSLRDLAYFKGKEKIFLHTDVGFNYRMTNLQAAIGLAQIKKIEKLVEIKRNNAKLYNSLLKKIDNITLPVEKSWAKNVYWMYCILVENGFGMSRDKFIEKLKEKGVDTRPFFISMHHQTVFKKLGLFKGEQYPVAEDISKKGLYLPSSLTLTKDQIKYICKSIEEIKK